jgi:predicted nuclease of predicted toxin-antitoxin system
MNQLRFYTDVHISKATVIQLRQKDVDIIHCGEVGMSDAEDEDHLRYATENGRIMITCDEDFERYHAMWQTASHEHGGIVYFKMNESCKEIGLIVKEVLFLCQAANYQTDLYNQIWRV